MRLIFKTIFFTAIITHSSAQTGSLAPFAGKLVSQVGAWSIYQQQDSYILLSKGEVSYSESSNGRQKVLLPNALKPLYLGLSVNSKGERRYFFYVNRLFIDEFLRGDEQASSSNLVATDDSTLYSATLYEQLKRVYPSFTVFSFEPTGSPKEAIEFEKRYQATDGEAFNRLVENLFLPVILIDWQRQGQYLWIDKIDEAAADGQTYPQTAHFFEWIIEGIELNSKVAPQMVEQLYLGSSFDVMRERPYFFVNFDFNNLKKAYNILEDMVR